MSPVTAVRFTPTAEELRASVRSVPGLALPSFAIGAPRETHSAAAVQPSPHDPRLLLALGLQGAADGIVQTVSWSPGVVVRRSIAVAGAVAASVTRRDFVCATTTQCSSSFNVALLPAAQLSAELAATLPLVDGGHRRSGESRTVGMVASRAIVEASRHGDPLLVEDVATALWVDADTAGMLKSLQARQSHGLRVRCFDARSGRCVAADDWFGSEHGWRRLRLALPPSDRVATSSRRVLDEATLSIAETSDAGIRRSLTWLSATLLRVIAR